MPSSVEASVIMPVFNAAEHIEEQLQALARQRTDVSWELIVADNGSSDGTRAILERVAPGFSVPMRVLDASACPGAGGARNAAAAAAAGDFLLFCDADDVADELWVNEMVSALRDHESVVGRLEVAKLNGEELESWRPSLEDKVVPLFGGRPWPVSANCGVRAAVFAATDGYDERFRGGGEDLDLALRMRAQGIDTFPVARAVIHYRYRVEARATVRQFWGYGRAWGPVYRVHDLEPSTFLDAIVMCFRSSKRAVHDLLRARKPVRAAVGIAYVAGEASRFWRDPSFWQPVCRSVRVENPLPVQRARLARVIALIGSRGG